MINKLGRDVINLLQTFVKGRAVKIVSDGDLDGIFATGFLIRYFRNIGLEVEYIYPKPERINGMIVQDCILVELSLTRGIIYKGENLLFDHHNGPTRVELFKENKVVKSIVFPNCKSIAQLVHDVLRIKVNKELLEAINDIDNGIYEKEVAEKLHRAYLLNISSVDMRKFLTESVANQKWKEILEWAEKESRKWRKHVEPKIRDMFERTYVIVPGVAVFTYFEQNDIEKAARTEAMLKLEDKYDIVVSIGLDDQNRAVSARIATRKPIDLSTVYKQLRKLGYTAGGRKNVGGVQFNYKNLKDILRELEKIKWPIYDPSVDVIYAEPSLNIFYVDTFYLYPDAIRELDFVGVLKIMKNEANVDHLFYAFEEVSHKHEETKTIVDLTTGMKPIFWYKGNRELNGIPALSNSKILYYETVKKSDLIKDALIRALEIDAEIHNLIYYCLFFLSHNKAKMILQDIMSSYRIQGSEPTITLSNYLADLSNMLFNVIMGKNMAKIPSLLDFNFDLQRVDIFTKTINDLKLQRKDELILLFMVQRIEKETKAYKHRVKNQAKCIKNIVEKIKNQAKTRLLLLSNEKIEEQINDLKKNLSEKTFIIEIISEEDEGLEKFREMLKGKKVIVIILSDYRKESIWKILNILPPSSCLIVIPESRIEPIKQQNSSKSSHQKKLLDVKHGYFEGKIYENRALYLSPDEIKKLKEKLGVDHEHI